MKRLLFSLICIPLFFSSCKYAELFRVKPLRALSADNEDAKDAFTMENDTLKITYDFWTEHGVMHFTIYNKLNIPLYADWRKSALIMNDEKKDYWKDVEVTNAKTDYRGVGYSRGYYSAGVGTSDTKAIKTKDERISFIAPHSKIEFGELPLVTANEVTLGKTKDVPVTYVVTGRDSSKGQKVFYKNYTPETSPFVFKNFVTFSTTENFTSEFYVENEFYVHRISIMRRGFFTNGGEYNHNDWRYTSSKYFYLCNEFYFDPNPWF